jgi:hypothetical protein
MNIPPEPQQGSMFLLILIQKEKALSCTIVLKKA